MYKTKPFARFQRRERIGDAALCLAVSAAETGRIDADPGGGLIKQCVARQGAGKRGGYGTVIAYRMGTRAVFLLGFANSEQADIGSDELAELKRRGSGVLETAVEALETMIADDEILEVHYGGSAES